MAKRLNSELTLQQERFVAEYIKTLPQGNGKQAAIAAGYSARSAEVTASRLLTKTKVAAAIAIARAQQTERIHVEADTFIQELAAICLVDIADAYDEAGNLQSIKDMPRSLRRAIAGVETVIRNAKAGDGVTDTIHKIKLVDKRGALELMLRHLGQLVDRKEVGKPGEFSKLSDDDLQAELETAHRELSRLLKRR